MKNNGEIKDVLIIHKRFERSIYEYTLIKRIDYLRERSGIPQPCFMGFEGYALTKIERIR